MAVLPPPPRSDAPPVKATGIDLPSAFIIAAHPSSVCVQVVLRAGVVSSLQRPKPPLHPSAYTS